MTTFAMPAAPLLLRPLLAGARVELTDDVLDVRLGRGWRASIPRASVRAADHDPTRTISIGAHGWRGRWLVNTSTKGLVRLEIEPAATGRCLGVPHRLTELTLSLADPDGFLAALSRG